MPRFLRPQSRAAEYRRVGAHHGSGHRAARRPGDARFSTVYQLVRQWQANFDHRVVLFATKVLLDRCTMKVNGKPTGLARGMTVTVGIKTSTRRQINFLALAPKAIGRRSWKRKVASMRAHSTLSVQTKRITGRLALLACLVSGCPAWATAFEISVKTMPDNSAVTVDGSVLSVARTSTVQSARLMRNFNDGLRRTGLLGQIESCTQEIVIAVGVKNGNNSFGGICRLRVNGSTPPVQVEVCADEVVGYFVIAALAPTPHLSDDRLIAFVASNCVGG